MQSLTLKKRVINASFWTFGGNFLSQFIRFSSNLLMTRILMPEMFGLMALANVFIMGLILLSDVGLNQSLIQNKRTDRPFINTIWTLQVMRGWLIWVISIVIAVMLMLLSHYAFWPTTSVYADSILPYVLIVIGFNAVINGYESTKLVINSRNISVKFNVVIGLVSQILGIIAMFIWVYYSKTVWAMVAGAIVSSLVQMISSHLLISGEQNKLHWDYSIFKEIIHFGKWVFLASILGFLVSSSDRLLLGGFVDANTLGLYAIAFYLYSAIREVFGNVMHKVGFAALSETYRENPENLKNIFYKIRLPFDLALIFLAAFLFVSGSSIVEMLYDNRYLSSGWMLQILSLSLFEWRYKMAAEAYMAIGKPKIITSLILLNLFILYIAGSCAFMLFDLKGIIWVIACATIMIIPAHFYYLQKNGLFSWRAELKVLPIAVVGYGAGVAFNYLVRYLNFI